MGVPFHAVLAGLPGFFGGHEAAATRPSLSHQSSLLQRLHDNEDAPSPSAQQEGGMVSKVSLSDSGSNDDIEAFAHVKWFDTEIVDLNVEKRCDFVIAPVARMPVEMVDIDLSSVDKDH